VNWIPVVPGAAVGNPGDTDSVKEYVFVGLDGLLVAQPEHPSSKIKVNAAESRRLQWRLLSVEPDKVHHPLFLLLDGGQFIRT
jgi:hypothetical protein